MRRNGVAIVAVGLALLLGTAAGTPAIAQQTSQADAEPAAEPQVTPAVNDLIEARRDLQTFLFSLGEIDTAGFVEEPEDQLAELDNRLVPISEIVANNGLEDAGLDALLDLETDLRTELDDLGELADTLGARASRRDRQLDDLADRRDRWQTLLAAAEERDAPAEIIAIAGEAQAQLDQTEAILKADRDAALEVRRRVLDLQLDAAAFEREIRSRREALELSSQRAAGLPLWSRDLGIRATQIEDLRATFAGAGKSLQNYLSDHGLAVLIWFLAFGLATHLLLNAGRAKVSEFAKTGKADARAMAVFEKPGAAAVLVALIAVLWFAPSGPVSLENLLVALLPWPAARLATTVFAGPLRLSVYVLTAALSIVALRPLYEVLPLLSRALSVAVPLAVAAAFYIDLKRGNFSRAMPNVRPPRLRAGVLLICALLLLALVTDALGYVGFAGTLRAMTLGGLGYGLIFIVLSYVLNGLTLALLQSRALAKLSTVKHNPWAIVRVLKKLVVTIAFVSWLTLTLAQAGLASRAWNLIEAFLQWEFSVGALSIHVASVIAGLLVLWLAWAASHFIRFVMQSRALDYQSAASGLSFAISKVLGYAVLVAGFLLAIAAMGVDLTRVTVLAGALGVGIGLGLQNIANNFVSGIILLFERPVQVNDIAKVDETIGTIKEIGIRSTTLQTFDGAEVIVPNADFMAKTVLNWTKSNRRRRAEIDLGVAYGTDTGKVLEILDQAAREHEDVLEDPAPLATFTGFGDSSLNFRLYLWLSDLANFLKAPSMIRQDILRRLNEAGIEIPFPQRDIRVTMSGEAGNADGRPGGGPSRPIASPPLPAGDAS